MSACSQAMRAGAGRMRASGSSDRVRPRALDGPSFYALLPFRVAREIREFRPDAVLAQGAQEAALVNLGRRLARVPTRVIADIHGDPAAPTRLYGSPVAQGAGAVRGLAREARAPRRGRRSHDLGLHLGRRSGGGSRADCDVRGVHGSRAVPRDSSRGRCPSHRSLSSSACSSATRPSTSSPMRGALRRRRCPTRRCTSSGGARFAMSLRNSWPSCPGRRAGPRCCRRPTSLVPWTRRRCSSFPRARRGSGASWSRPSVAAAGSSRAASAAFRTSSRTG